MPVFRGRNISVQDGSPSRRTVACSSRPTRALGPGCSGSHAAARPAEAMAAKPAATLRRVRATVQAGGRKAAPSRPIRSSTRHPALSPPPVLRWRVRLRSRERAVGRLLPRARRPRKPSPPERAASAWPSVWERGQLRHWSAAVQPERPEQMPDCLSGYTQPIEPPLSRQQKSCRATNTSAGVAARRNEQGMPHTSTTNPFADIQVVLMFILSPKVIQRLVRRQTRHPCCIHRMTNEGQTGEQMLNNFSITAPLPPLRWGKTASAVAAA